VIEYWSVERRYPPFNHFSSTAMLQHSKLIRNNNTPDPEPIITNRLFSIEKSYKDAIF
jgi:hypothetical protein